MSKKDAFAEIEEQLRARGVKCFSIRPLTRGFKVNYRVDDYRWKEGKPGPTLRAAFENSGLLSAETVAPVPEPTDDFEDLLG